MVRRRIVVGNWKMYKTIPETQDFVKKVAPLVVKSQAEVYLAVPFTSISDGVAEAKVTRLVIGAQNMNDATEGAFTGEVAGRMLVDAGAQFVILGHSERRHVFGETSEFVNRKVLRALKDGLEPIVCIGEKEDDDAEVVLAQQLEQSLADVPQEDAAKLIVAYEPVWAIGTGKSATPEDAQKAQLFCRQWLTKKWGEEVAEQIEILYGGSVKPANAAHLLEQNDIDGLLVGGASLDPETFAGIVNAHN